MAGEMSGKTEPCETYQEHHLWSRVLHAVLMQILLLFSVVREMCSSPMLSCLVSIKESWDLTALL